MAKRSAGLLIFRRTGAELQVLLVHPGGPFWAKKDAGVWSVPKGLVDDGEDELAAAQREVEEEIGTRIHGRFERLGEYKQRGGKVVIAWSVEADIDIDPTAITSNTFLLEWPPRSGQMKEFPEVDRAGWFGRGDADGKILEGQKPILSDFALRRVGR
ncbi:NUDIX domain-containing protein [Mesorhizobium sp. A556]